MVTLDLEGVCCKSYDRLSEGVSVGDSVRCCVVGVDTDMETIVAITDFTFDEKKKPSRSKRVAKYETNMAVSVVLEVRTVYCVAVGSGS